MSDILKKHRVIGIRHALRQLKDAGLVDDESLYPDEAVADVQGELLSTARSWYKIGSRRGGLEVLEAFLNGDFEVLANPDGTKEIVAHTRAVRWTKGLKVRVGSRTRRVEEREYTLTLKKLGFE